MITKELLIKALEDAGHRESALCLQNWNELDSVAQLLKSELEKKVREEDLSSRHTDPSINPALGGKYGKIHGGDPKKLSTRPNKSGGLDDVAVDMVNGKPKKRISGASSLRTLNPTTRQEDGQLQSD